MISMRRCLSRSMPVNSRTASPNCASVASLGMYVLPAGLSASLISSYSITRSSRESGAYTDHGMDVDSRVSIHSSLNEMSPKLSSVADVPSSQRDASIVLLETEAAEGAQPSTASTPV